MAGQSCWVKSLANQVVVFTGRVRVDDEWVTQRECGRLVEQKRATWRDDPSPAMTLLIHGDIVASNVVDADRHYGEKLVFVETERSRGHHIHVVDPEGLSDLLHGRAARCRRLRRSQGLLTIARDPVEELLGQPFEAGRRPARRTARELTIDLEALDRATVAHQRTLEQLASALERVGVEVHRATGRGPMYDLGWRRGRQLHVAEVKSLSGANEDQQVRLAFGQVLDYTAQLRLRTPTVRPLIVLERKPRAERWQHLAEMTGVTLTWAPGFDSAIGLATRATA